MLYTFQFQTSNNAKIEKTSETVEVLFIKKEKPKTNKRENIEKNEFARLLNFWLLTSRLMGASRTNVKHVPKVCKFIHTGTYRYCARKKKN
jgi:hypothetical protein